MRAATLYRYSIPMEAGVILRHQRLKSRDGLLVKLQQGEQTGWGEIAPCQSSARKRCLRHKLLQSLSYSAG